MGTRQQNIEEPDSCLNKAEDDEPLFILKASDCLAPQLVRDWAARLEEAGGNAAKIEGARDVADAMDEWAAVDGNKLPD